MVIVEAKTIELKSVGTILIERSRQAKHLSLSVRPFKGARVAVPFGVSFAKAERFARSKTGWIKKTPGQNGAYGARGQSIIKK